jgi:hypothetical protein
MVADMSYKTCSSVIDSWEEVRRIEKYEEKVGVELFVKFFELEPEAKRIFGFRGTQSTEEMRESRRFTKHAAYFIQMVRRLILQCLNATRIELNDQLLTFFVLLAFRMCSERLTRHWACLDQTLKC